MKKYNSILSELETEQAIKKCKDTFQLMLSGALNLQRVTAPMIVKSGEGINDDLNGEAPISFINGDGIKCEVVHSLAKWKRIKLGELKNVHGIYTDMNAIRTHEITDYIHSIYVDQWDWEAIISNNQRNITYLFKTVRKIYNVLRNTETIICNTYPKLNSFLPEDLYIFSYNELCEKYNDGQPINEFNKADIEYKACKEYGAIFVYGIGIVVNGRQQYDMRAPDYDDWELNGDLIIWSPVTETPIELSSMGIRVDEDSLVKQLKALNHYDWINRKYHRMVVNKELPLTIGGGIGQSRLCMLLLHKAHIGEVQAGIWTAQTIKVCEENNIHLK